MADSTPRPRGHWSIHVGANSASVLMNLFIGAWLYYFLWRGGALPSWMAWFTTNRADINVAWLVAIFVPFELLSSALTVFRGGRWFLAVLDILSGFLPVMLIAIALTHAAELSLTGARLEIASLMLWVSISTLVVSIAITLIVNTRMVLPGSPVIASQ